jgi:SM-20-related protein
MGRVSNPWLDIRADFVNGQLQAVVGNWDWRVPKRGPVHLTSQFVALQNLLLEEEWAGLLAYTLEHESKFRATTVTQPVESPRVIDLSHSRSRVLFNLGQYRPVILQRVRSYLPRVLGQFGHREFTPSKVEVQITASNDREFFHAHSDSTHADYASREITFVYYFHQEPKQFTGGELRIYDSVLAGGRYLQEDRSEEIDPVQDQIVFFPSSLVHEILPVGCRSGAFAESRFTANGWLH